jgi:hypothetical protein
MELESPPRDYNPTIDRRPRVPEPLPVRLITIDDARLPSAAGLERELDAFYVGVLGFARRGSGEEISYRAENFSLTFEVIEPPVRRHNMRPLAIEVPSLADLELKLIETEAEYSRRRGLLPGEQAIVMLDPAGNWLEIIDRRGI